MAFASRTGSTIQSVQLAVLTYMNRPTANSTAAIVIWLIGAAATKNFLLEIGILEGYAAFLGFALASITQGLLTILEGPVWHSHLRQQQRMRMVLGSAALVVDTALNTGGVWYYLQNLGNTTFWQAIASATGTQTGPASLTILLLSVGVGLVISAGPEALWDI